MQHCPKCKVSVNGDKICCPLCQGELAGEGEPEREAFPKLPPPKYTRNFILRLISFLCIIAIVISISMNIMIPTRVWWSAFVSLGVVSAWITLSVAFLYRKKVYKNITLQLFIITLLSIFWDIVTGMHGWSFDFVIPGCCLISSITIASLSRILKSKPTDYMIYLILANVYGFVPILLIVFGQVGIIYPSVTCVAISLIITVGLILFAGRDMKEQLGRKLHV